MGKRTYKSSDEFIERIKTLYEGGMSLDEVAKEVDSSRAWVSRCLRDAGIQLRPKTGSHWSAEEDAILRANASMPIKEVMALLPLRTKSSIMNRRKTIGVAPKANRRSIVEADYAFIKANPTMTDYALAKTLGVNPLTVLRARKRGGLAKTYQCVECGVQLAGQGQYCKSHRRLAQQLRYYASKSNVKGREFSLSEDVVYSLMTSNCVYCGGKGGGIDRVDSSKGYVEGNVVSCCKRCNIAKNNMSVDEFKAHVLRIATHLGLLK